MHGTTTTAGMTLRGAPQVVVGVVMSFAALTSRTSLLQGLGTRSRNGTVAKSLYTSHDNR